MAVVLTAVGLILVGCSGTKPAAQASPSPMAVAHYQQVLPSIDEGLARTTQRLRSAQKPSAVGSAAALAQNRVSLTSDYLRA
jgi:hypothetical protein